MEAACKKCWSAAGFCKLLATLSRGTNRGLTPARTCQDRRKLFVPAVAGREMLGVPYTNRPWCCHNDMVFWLGFAPLAFGSDKNLFHKAVDTLSLLFQLLYAHAQNIGETVLLLLPHVLVCHRHSTGYYCISWNLPSTHPSWYADRRTWSQSDPLHVWLARSTVFPWQGRRVADQQQVQVLVQGSRAELLPWRWPWNVLSLPPNVRCLRTEATVHW